MHPMLNIAVRAARSAGQVIAKNFGDHANVQTAEKAKNDLVTNVDREAEQTIVRTLLKAYPDHCVVGEEFGIKVHALVTVQDIREYLADKEEYAHLLPLMDAYMKQYCVF